MLVIGSSQIVYEIHSRENSPLIFQCIFQSCICACDWSRTIYEIHREFSGDFFCCDSCACDWFDCTLRIVYEIHSRENSPRIFCPLANFLPPPTCSRLQSIDHPNAKGFPESFDRQTYEPQTLTLVATFRGTKVGRIFMISLYPVNVALMPRKC